jgi:hypothetical protein
MKNTSIHLKWTALITEEFYSAGDLEREKLGKIISPFSDREEPQLRKSQIGFMDFMVRPLVTAWTDFTRDRTALAQVCQLQSCVLFNFASCYHSFLFLSCYFL